MPLAPEAKPAPAPRRPLPAGALSVEAIHAILVEEIPGASLVVDLRHIHLRVPAADLPRAAALLRDEPRLRFDSLCCLSGVDTLKWPGAKKGEFPHSSLFAVYHLHSLKHRHELTLKVKAPRAAPAIPSVAGIWPVAAWFEREIFDLYGIDFPGHPDLRRILMPEDWIGHPLRKDYAYPDQYGGVPTRREGQRFDDGPYAAAPAGAAAGAECGVRSAECTAASPPPTSHLPPPTAGAEGAGAFSTLHMGPHHPATHGVLQLELVTDGEVVKRCRPEIGYLHRAIEKISECVEYPQVVPYTDRVDYVCAMNSNLAYCLAAERLLATDPATAVAVPERAEHLRVLVAELNRISSHLVAVGAMSMDLGAYTPFLHGIAQRETVNDLFERLCGQRLTYNYITIGGVSHDLHAGGEAEIAAFLDELEREMVRFNRLITANAIFRDRCAGLAVIDAPTAAAYGLVGPNLRGSGVDFDLRRDAPYGIYERFRFQVPVGQAFAGRHGRVGDCYDRYVVRLLEILESIAICRQALKAMPPATPDKPADPVGGWQADASKALRKPPQAEVYCRVENPRGETGWYLVGDGTKNPYRAKIRTGSFTALSLFEDLVRDVLIADVVAIVGSFDIVLPEVDR